MLIASEVRPQMCFRRLCLSLVLAVSALGMPTASAAHRSNIDACDLISTAKLASILGVQNVQIQSNIPGTSSVDNVSGVTHSVCNGLAWSGAAPTTKTSGLLAVASGKAAAFALDTWAPDEASKYVDRWTGKGYDDLLGPSIIGALVLPGFPPFKPYHPHRLHPRAVADEAIGVSGNPSDALTTIVAASGVWYDAKSSAIVSIAVGGSARNPTVKQLDRIAAIAVTAFGLKDFPLH